MLMQGGENREESSVNHGTQHGSIFLRAVPLDLQTDYSVPHIGGQPFIFQR
jgi:hypothetical protein